MACCHFPLTASINHHTPPINNCTATSASNRTTTFCLSSSTIDRDRSFHPKTNRRLTRCNATNPQSEPPSKKHESSSLDVAETLTRFQDTLPIFFAVLFWMSLFFWSCAWDGRNNGKSKKGRFRK